MTGEDQTGKITEQLKQRMTREQKEDSTVYVEEKGGWKVVGQGQKV
jgi:hypothetical protein